MDNSIMNDKEFEERQRRILELNDCILDKIERALADIDRSVLRLKEKQKTIEYDVELKKPIHEEVTESEKVEIIDSVIDTSALKQLVATLKEVKDINMGLMNSVEDFSEESENGIIMLSSIDEALEDGVSA